MQKSRIKKAFAMIMAIVMITSASIFTVSAASPEELGRLPIRATFEEAKAIVDWCDDERTIHIELMDNIVVLHTRQPLAYVNDEVKALQDDIILWEGRSFISPDDLFMILSSMLPVEIENDIDALRSAAITFMNKFAAGDVSGAVQMMSGEFQDVLAEMQLFGMEGFEITHIMTWISRGSLIDWEISDYQDIDDSTAFDFTVNHTIGIGSYRVIVNSDGEIINFIDLGFVFEPIPVAEDATYTAYPIIVGEGTPWPLEGLLTMPHEASADNPVPAVVLVHGSEEVNMDGSIFDNRLFHEIATYLSSNGIAVIRYHKSIWAHAAIMETYGTNLTIQRESIEDALLAAEILRADPRISNIFVIGHSMGGMLAPRIAEEAELDGAILLGAPARALYKLLYDGNVQGINAMLSAGQISQDEADEMLAMAASVLEEAQNMPNLTEAELQEMFIFGFPAVWLHSFHDALPLPIISRNIIPTLILHGDGDFQVSTDSEFNLFVEHTENYEHVQTILYAGLTHFFTQTQTEYTYFREYMNPSPVDPQVLRDIVEWIMSNS